MNFLDATVTKRLSKPYYRYNKWCVDVEYDCWGRIEVTILMFKSKEEANCVDVGYEFLT